MHLFPVVYIGSVEEKPHICMLRYILLPWLLENNVFEQPNIYNIFEMFNLSKNHSREKEKLKPHPKPEDVGCYFKKKDKTFGDVKGHKAKSRTRSSFCWEPCEEQSRKRRRQDRWRSDHWEAPSGDTDADIVTCTSWWTRDWKCLKPNSGLCSNLLVPQSPPPRCNGDLFFLVIQGASQVLSTRRRDWVTLPEKEAPVTVQGRKGKLF